MVLFGIEATAENGEYIHWLCDNLSQIVGEWSCFKLY